MGLKTKEKSMIETNKRTEMIHAHICARLATELHLLALLTGKDYHQLVENFIIKGGLDDALDKAWQVFRKEKEDAVIPY